MIIFWMKAVHIEMACYQHVHKCISICLRELLFFKEQVWPCGSTGHANLD